MEEPLHKRRQGEQDGADARAQAVASMSSGPAATPAVSPVRPVLLRAAEGHLKGVGRHFEQQRYPGQCGKRAENGRAGRARR